ncbi:MAG: hypothetical protein FJ276_19015 [Planctomycetes bacterium]|nr:hypothetical protein [Planctomycetota bacterium]
MWTLFFVCAVLGGSVFIVQFVLSLVGFGGHDGMGDVPGSVDVPGDVDFSGDLGHVGHVGGDVSTDTDVHGSTWLFGVISFRTVVAALTFFGLAGMASSDAQLSPPISLLIAMAAGALAMYSVHYLMQALFRMRHDGTAHIERTVGQRATVYIPIPGKDAGTGKVQMRTQGRIMEYAARTQAIERLATGTVVRVTGVLSPMTLEVEPLDANEATASDPELRNADDSSVA